MSRLILVPQYPTNLRYSQWWISKFPKNLSKYFNEIKVLGKESDLIKEEKEFKDIGELFSPIEASMKFEFEQIEEYYKMKLYDDDIMLLLDTSFPGFFPHVLYHKRPNKVFGICHATSVNNLDYFQPINFKYNNSKRDSEISLFNLLDKVFVASHYHKNKLINNNFPKNIINLGSLPNPPIKTLAPNIKDIPFNERKNDIISVSRPTPQKVNRGLEKFVEEKFNTTIKRPENIKNWEDYFNFLQNSKVLLLTGCEDTYGYSIVDASLNGCRIVAPKSFSYPELLKYNHEFYNKNDLFSLYSLIFDNLENKNKNINLKQLGNQRNIDCFYDNLAINMMEG